MREIKFRSWDKKYEFGSDGTVYSLNYNHTGKRKQLKTYLDQDGYPYFFMQINRVRKKAVIHRYIARCFLSLPPTPEHQVNHIDGNRQNNDVSNLEWVTSRENTLHGWTRGRKISDAQRAAMSKATRAYNMRRWHGEAA